MKLRLRFPEWVIVIFVLIAPSFCQNSNNTSSLSCWETRKGGTFQTRHAKTPISKSASGSAYAEVTAEASTDAGQAQFCKNKAQLFYSQDGNDYKMVYEKPGLDDQGVGIRLLGWSSNGSQLLMELLVWGYDRDNQIVHSGFVFEPANMQVRELPLDDALQRLFGKDCEFDFSLVGWEGDDNVLVRATKTPPTNRYQQTFCVEKPSVYAFSELTGTISASKGSAEASHNRP